MTDRVSARQNCVKMRNWGSTSESDWKRYELQRDDAPSVVGTALNKANLLSDEAVAALWGDDVPETDPTVSDAFMRLKELVGSGIGGGGGGGDYSNAGIGEIAYSINAPSPNSDWLQCDGSPVSSSEYPELADYLASTNGSGLRYTILSRSNIGNFLSNGVLFDGYYWIYSHNNNNQNFLYGYSVNGSDTKRIQVTDDSTTLSNLKYLERYPIALSIANGKLFISQIRNNDISSGLALVYCDFSGSESSLGMRDVFSSYGTARIRGSNGNIIPYVVYENDYYYMSVGTLADQEVTYWFWNDGYSVPQIATVPFWFELEGVRSTKEMSGGYGRLAFNKKNNGEMFVSQCIRDNSSVTARYRSKLEVAPYFDRNYRDEFCTEAFTGYPKFNLRNNSNITPIAGNDDNVIVDIAFQGGNLIVNINESSKLRAVSVSSDYVKATGNSKWFPDAAIYSWANGVWLIFVGNGFIFTNDIFDETHYGFLGSSNPVFALGTIKYFGHIEVDDGDDSTFYISGTSDSYQTVIASVNIDRFSGSGSTAYLPELYDENGRPGWIRAKVSTETEEEGE